MIITTNHPNQLFVSGSELLLVLDLPIGETVEFSELIYTHTEHADVQSIADHITTNALSIAPGALSNLPASVAAEIKQAAGVDVLDINFSGLAIGATSSAAFRTVAMGGAGTVAPQANGVQGTLNTDPQGLVAAFGTFFAMRPRSSIRGYTELITHDAYALAGDYTLEILAGTGGVMEPDDTLEVFLTIGGEETLVAQLSDDLAVTTVSHAFNLASPGYVSIRIVSHCGDGPVEVHVIDRIRILG